MNIKTKCVIRVKNTVKESPLRRFEIETQLLSKISQCEANNGFAKIRNKSPLSPEVVRNKFDTTRLNTT